VFFSAAIHVGDERSYLDASGCGGFELRLNISAVKAKNCDVYGFFCFLNGG